MDRRSLALLPLVALIPAPPQEVEWTGITFMNAKGVRVDPHYVRATLVEGKRETPLKVRRLSVGEYEAAYLTPLTGTVRWDFREREKIQPHQVVVLGPKTV